MKALALEDLITLTEKLHNSVVLSEQIKGLAGGKSLESVLARPQNRMIYGLVQDEYHYAACCCCSIIQGHPFNDANKRTGLALMLIILKLNGVDAKFPQIEMADRMVDIAKGNLDDLGLARWLRINQISD